ncbi:MAG: hypothetical protein S4CHLAM102_11580 [Chlamydiia bacterium]|nr:hypothetical protein [Chlamydiia bacterium]
MSIQQSSIEGAGQAGVSSQANIEISLPLRKVAKESLQELLSQRAFEDHSPYHFHAIYVELVERLESECKMSGSDTESISIHDIIIGEFIELSEAFSIDTFLIFVKTALDVCPDEKAFAATLYNTTEPQGTSLDLHHLWKFPRMKQWLRKKYSELIGPSKPYSQTILSQHLNGKEFCHSAYALSPTAIKDQLALDLRDLAPADLMSLFYECCALIGEKRKGWARKQPNDEIKDLQQILLAVCNEIVIQKASDERSHHVAVVEFLLKVDPELNGQMPKGCIDQVCELYSRVKCDMEIAHACLRQMSACFPDSPMAAVMNIADIFEVSSKVRDRKFSWTEKLEKWVEICRRDHDKTAKAVAAYHVISSMGMMYVKSFINFVLHGYKASLDVLIAGLGGDSVEEKLKNAEAVFVHMIGTVGYFGTDVQQSQAYYYCDNSFIRLRVIAWATRDCPSGWNGSIRLMLFRCFRDLSLVPKGGLDKYSDEICTNAAGWGVVFSQEELTKDMIIQWKTHRETIADLRPIAEIAQAANFSCYPLYQHAKAEVMDEFSYGYLVSLLKENEKTFKELFQLIQTTNGPEEYLTSKMGNQLHVFNQAYGLMVGEMTDTLIADPKLRLCAMYCAFALFSCGQFPDWKERRCKTGNHFVDEIIEAAPGSRDQKLLILSHLSLAYFRLYIRNQKVTRAQLDDFFAILEARSERGGHTLPLVYLYLQHAVCLEKLCRDDPTADHAALKRSVQMWMGQHAALKKAFSEEVVPTSPPPPTPPPAPPAASPSPSTSRSPLRAAAGSTSPPAARRKKKKKPSHLKNMSLEPGVYRAKDFPQAKLREKRVEQISPHLDLVYVPFEVDPNLEEQLQTKHLISKVADRAPEVNEPRRHFDSELDRLGLNRPPVVLRARYLRLAQTAKRTQGALQIARADLGKKDQALLDLKQRMISLEDELARERATVAQLEIDCAKQAQKVEKHKRRDQEVRLRANALQVEVDELKARPPIVQQVVVQGSCEVEEEALLYCPITHKLPQDPVVLASAEEALKMGFHDEGYNAFVLEREAVKEGVKVKKAPRHKRELIQLTRMKKEGVAGDLSFAKDAITQMRRVNLNLNSDPVTKILNRLVKVLTARMDVGSGIASRCQDLVGKTNSALEIVLKACLEAKKVDIANPSFAHQRVSIGRSHKLVSLANLLLSHLKFLKDKSALQREIDQMDQNGFDRFDGRYLGEQAATPLTTLMEEVENIDEDACLVDPASQIALIEQVREIYTMCSNVIGLAAQLMQATHNELA